MTSEPYQTPTDDPTAVSRLSGQTLALDGDLLRYQDGVPADGSSETQRAIFLLRARLRLNEAEILRDLKLEKSPAFEQSVLYQRLYALAEATSGAPRPRADSTGTRLSTLL